jgi:DNA-binding CsgD family transcriptional regulator
MRGTKTPESSERGGGSEDVKCPHCGALESKGGCEDPALCVAALAQLEAADAREQADLLDQSNQNKRSFHLLLAGFEALDLLNIGLAVTGPSGFVLVANRSFEHILASRDGLELSSDGVLQAQKECGPALSELLQRTSRGGTAGKGSKQDTVMAVTRSSGKRPLTLQVRSAKMAAGAEEAGPSVLVFVLDPELRVEAAEEELRQLYGLTSTEARLANLLMEGKTVDECCELLRVRHSTGRTHLQHLFEKVGVKRQSELVSVLWKSIGLVRTRRSNKDGNPQSTAKTASLNDALVRMLMNRYSRAFDDR